MIHRINLWTPTGNPPYSIRPYSSWIGRRRKCAGEDWSPRSSSWRRGHRERSETVRMPVFLFAGGHTEVSVVAAGGFPLLCRDSADRGTE
jgi:hypothetical protein